MPCLHLALIHGRNGIRWCCKHGSYPKVIGARINSLLGFVDRGGADTDNGILGKNLLGLCDNCPWVNIMSLLKPLMGTYPYHPGQGGHPPRRQQWQHQPGH